MSTKLYKCTPKYTHFISMPLLDDNFQKGFSEFKDLVAKNCGEEFEKFFVPQAKFHLTLGLLRLPTEDNVQRAAALLESCTTHVKSFLIENKLQLAVKGLGHFKGRNPKKASVLFANVIHSTDPCLLQTLINSIRDQFTQENLLADNPKTSYNIHATLMKASRTKFRHFDAQEILKLYGDYSFGEGFVSQIHLSAFHKKSLDKYYASDGTFFLT